MNPDFSTITDFFQELSFEEESHSYFVKGERLSTSVSGVIKEFVPQVDFSMIARAIDKRDKLPTGTTERIWKYKADYSCAKGDKGHFFGEMYMFHRNLKPTDPYEEAIVRFWKDLPSKYIPVFPELQMFHKGLMFGGTADILLYNTETGKYVIADYKTNEDIFKNYKGQTLLGPFKDLLNSPFNKYQIQFSLYQILLEQAEVEVEDRVLVWLKPNSDYELHFTEDYTDKLRKYLIK